MPQDNQFFTRLKTFQAYPSGDGRSLYAMTVPAGQPPLFIEADRMQASAWVHDLVMATYLMARRSGTKADPFINQAWILRPCLDLSKVRYHPATRMIEITLCFADQLPIPLSVSLFDWIGFKSRIDSHCGLLM